MKTDKEMISDLIKRKEAYDAKREAANRRLKIAASALAVVILTASLPVTAFIVSNRRANAPGTEPGSVTAETVSTDTVTEEATAADVTEMEGTETNAVGNTEEDSISKPGVKPNVDPPNVRMTCGFPEDNLVSISTELYGSRSWLTDKVRKEYGLQDYGYRPWSKIAVCYGREEHGDIHEFEFRVKVSEEEIQNIMIYVESDEAEIITGNLMKSNVPADEAGSDGYITFPVKYKYKDGCTLAEMRYILFTSEKWFPEAEKFISESNSVFVKQFDYTVNSDLHGWSMYGIQSVFTVKDTDFICANSFDLQYMYETVAVYFGDVDENGVPLFITDTEMPGYKESPWCISKR